MVALNLGRHRKEALPAHRRILRSPHHIRFQKLRLYYRIPRFDAVGALAVRQAPRFIPFVRARPRPAARRRGWRHSPTADTVVHADTLSSDRVIVFRHSTLFPQS